MKKSRLAYIGMAYAGRPGASPILCPLRPARRAVLESAGGLQSGYSESDIEIAFVGLRPGEKLYEETLVDAERATATQFKKIFIAPPTGKTPPNFKPALMDFSDRVVSA